MSATPEKFVATVKAELEAGLETGTSATNTMLGAVERVSALNISTARSTMEEGSSYAQALAAVKEPKALLELQLGLLNPGAEQGIAYARALTTIGNETKDALTKLYEAQASTLAGKFRGTGRALQERPGRLRSRRGSHEERDRQRLVELRECRQGRQGTGRYHPDQHRERHRAGRREPCQNTKAVASAVKSAS